MKRLIVTCLFFTLLAYTKKIKEPLPVHTLFAGQMPAVATDLNNNIHIAFGSGDSLMYTSSHDGGISFNQPVCIDTLKDLVDYAMRGPQVAVTKETISIVALNKAGNIFSYIKNKGGRWVKSGAVNDEAETNKEGFISLGSNGNNQFFAVWLDLRNNKRNKIYGASSTDGGKTWGTNKLVYASPDSTVCECCKPSVMMEGDHVYVMFRNWLHGNRDLYFTTSVDGGTSFSKAVKLGFGNWRLPGCPMDGGGLTLNDKTVQTVWRRKDSIYTAQPGKAEQFIAIGKSCSIASANHKLVYAWVNEGKVFYRINDGQAMQAGNGSLPSLKKINDKSVICLWTDNGLIKYSLINIL